LGWKSGDPVGAARKNLASICIEQIGERGRDLVIGFQVKFVKTSFVVSEDGIIHGWSHLLSGILAPNPGLIPLGLGSITG
jgi:hypothetical protein